MRWVWLQNVPQSNVRQWRYCRYTRTTSMQNTTMLARMRFLSMKGKLRAAVPQREVGNGSSKVNERHIRVKHRPADQGHGTKWGGLRRGNAKWITCLARTRPSSGQHS